MKLRMQLWRDHAMLGIVILAAWLVWELIEALTK